MRTILVLLLLSVGLTACSFGESHKVGTSDDRKSDISGSGNSTTKDHQTETGVTDRSSGGQTLGEPISSERIESIREEIYRQ